MNLTWHIACKDISRLRLQLLPWLALQILQVVLSWHLLSPASMDYTHFIQIGLYFDLTAVVGLVLTFLLTATLVLADPLVGSDAFWITRPISGSRLFGAKVLTALVLFGPPSVLLWLPWWLHCGFGIPDLIWAASRTLVWQVAAMLPAFVLGSLVGRGGRFVMVAAILAAALFVGTLTVEAFGLLGPVSPDLMASRLWLALAILVLAGCVIVRRQYLTRGIVSSVWILGVATILAVGVIAASPWNVLADWHDLLWRSTRSEGLAGRIEGAAEVTTRSSPTNPSAVVAEVRVAVSGLPDDLVVGDGWADVELRWPDGMVVRQSHLALKSEPDVLPLRLALGLPREDSWRASWDPPTESWLAQQNPRPRNFLPLFHAGSLHRAPQASRHDVVRIAMELDSQEIRRFTSESAGCRVLIRGILARPTVRLEMGLASGATATRDGARVTLLGLAEHTYSRKSTNLGVSNTYAVGSLVVAEAPECDPIDTYWLDRERGLAWNLGAPWLSTAIPFSTRVGALYFDHTNPMVYREGNWTDLKADRSRNQFVAVSNRAVRRFTLEITTDRLKMGPAQGN